MFQSVRSSQASVQSQNNEIQVPNPSKQSTTLNSPVGKLAQMAALSAALTAGQVPANAQAPATPPTQDPVPTNQVVQAVPSQTLGQMQLVQVPVPYVVVRPSYEVQSQVVVQKVVTQPIILSEANQLRLEAKAAELNANTNLSSGMREAILKNEKARLLDWQEAKDKRDAREAAIVARRNARDAEQEAIHNKKATWWGALFGRR